MKTEELFVGRKVCLVKPYDGWEIGPFEIVGIQKERKTAEINVTLLADGFEYDGFKPSDLIPYVETCEVCSNVFMKCECPYGEIRRIKHDGTREQLNMEAEKLKKAAHSDWHVWTKTTKKECKICNPKPIQKKSYWRRVLSRFRK